MGKADLFPGLMATVPPNLALACGRWEALGRTAVLVGRDEVIVGALAIADTIRPSARSAVEELQALGLRTLYDDRDAGPGEKFADAELLGCPARVTVGRRTLAAGEIEVQVRRGRESRTVPLHQAAEAIAQLWQDLP